MTTTTATAPTTADLILKTWNAPNNVNSAFSTGMIMKAVGKSRSTVNDNLRKLAENGDVVRMDADGVTTWSLTPTRKAAIKRAAKKAAKPTPRKTAKAPATRTATRQATRTMKGFTVTEATEGAARTDTGRRRKGAIDFEIRAYFQEHNNEPQGSYAVAKAIGSSSGAAYVALRRMANEGKAVLTSTEPDRYNIDFQSDAWNDDEAE